MDDARGELFSSPPMDDDRPSKAGRVRFIMLLLVVVGGFYLVVDSMMEGGAYFFTVDQAVASPLAKTKMIRVKGIVALGSWKAKEGSSIHDFTVQGEDAEMQIHFEGPIPDVFREGAEVVATGKLESGVLMATEVTAKCPSKYEEGQVPEAARERMGLDKKGAAGY